MLLKNMLVKNELRSICGHNGRLLDVSPIEGKLL
jgi:hypothetical protein